MGKLYNDLQIEVVNVHTSKQFIYIYIYIYIYNVKKKKKEILEF